MQRTTPHYRFYGRRKGKTLSARRENLLTDQLEKYRFTLEDTIECERENWLEIGFGNGEFLSHMCQARPDIRFIGCEPFVNGVAALLASLEAPVENLRIWDDDARPLLDSLPAASMDRVYLLNPDPWPKTRHTRRRFIQPETLNQIARILKPQGRFIMSTDVKDLANWMHVHTWGHPAFEWQAETQNDWLTPPEDWPLDKTRYMKKALGGERIYWLRFKRI